MKYAIISVVFVVVELVGFYVVCNAFQDHGTIYKSLKID